MVSLKMREQCSICLDYFIVDGGYSCSKKHFLCWDCFEQHVRQISTPDSVGKCVDGEGNPLCPAECNETITLRNIAKDTTPQIVFDLLEELKANLKIKKAVDMALQEQKDRLDKEHKRILAIKDKDEREAEQLRLDIIDNYLTLRCPRCKVAFIDYIGCAALTCGCCRAGFCAFCLTDCGGDAHAHVTSCNENTSRNIYIPLEQLNIHHSQRRQKQIIDKIKNVDSTVKNLLCKKMAKDFSDLGIKIS